VKEEFSKASEFVRQSKFKTSNDQKLSFYAFFKQATVGPCSGPKPGFLDFEGKAKWSKWKELKDMTTIEAMKKYIAFLSLIKADWRDSVPTTTTKTTTTTTTTTSTVPETQTATTTTVVEEGKPEELIDESLLMEPEEDKKSLPKTVFPRMSRSDESEVPVEKDLWYWASQGDDQKVIEELQNLTLKLKEEEKGVGSEGEESLMKRVIDTTDVEGRTALHYGCDRGHLSLVKELLIRGASVNLQDCEGQSALHYACNCEEDELVLLLMTHGADPSLTDQEGLTPLEVANTSCYEIISSFPNKNK